MPSRTSHLLALLLLVTSLANAAPFQNNKKRWGWGSNNDDSNEWQPSTTSDSFIDFGKRTGFGSYASCDLQNAVQYMNLAAASSPSPLPQPDPSYTLFQVAIGRGTQNYTCDLSNDTAIPVAVGALATLFNVSCVAAEMPSLLAQLPGIALDLPIPSTLDTSSPIWTDMSGHHYFVNSTTPFFNLDTATNDYGEGAMSKSSSADAPADAIKGQNGVGDGAVAWLALDANYDWDCPDHAWKQVYRTNTAGGNPPATCTGQQATIEVQYAAEYWLFT